MIIPRTKSEVARRFDHFKYYAALNVKHYGDVEYTPERIVSEFGCTMEAAERAAKRCYEIAVEVFWEDAHETAKHVFGSGYKVHSEGRMGGWLVVAELGDPREWNGPTLQKWRRFARLIAADMEYRAGWEYARDMIEANEMAPKVGTLEANAEHARAQPLARLATAALAIHGELDGREWSPDTLDAIAGHIRAAGLAINEPESEDVYVAT